MPAVENAIILGHCVPPQTVHLEPPGRILNPPTPGFDPLNSPVLCTWRTNRLETTKSTPSVDPLVNH